MKLRKICRRLAEQYLVVPRILRQVRRLNQSPCPVPGMLIMGWYGKETTGDKAILASLLRHFEGRTIRILKSTYDPDYSRQTLKEIAAPQVECVPDSLPAFLRALPLVDVVVIGGGPLMESGRMGEWQERLTHAKALGKKVMVYGCGIGPLHTSRASAQVAGILRLADRITLRDDAAVARAVQLGIPRQCITLTADPAVGFWVGRQWPDVRRPGRLRIGVSLRRLGHHYIAGHSAEERATIEGRLHDAVEGALRQLLQDPANDLVLVPMQMHPSDDDRLLLEQMQRRLNHHERIQVIKDYASPAALLNQFETFDFVLAMRFHSVVFSLLTRTPLVAIDYDMGGGKNTALMRALHLADFLINIADINPERLGQLLHRGLAARTQIRRHIDEHFPRIMTLERQNSAQLQELLRAA